MGTSTPIRSSSEELCAGVLVGGRGRRLGGIDKSLLQRADGRTTLDGILALFDQIRVVADQPAIRVPTVVLGRPEQTPARPQRDFRRDRQPDVGPLGGLEQLLRWGGERGRPWCMLVACDMPAFSPAIVQRLWLARSPGARAVVPQTADDTAHYTAALYHRELLAPLTDFLDGGGRAMYRFLRGLPLPQVLEVECSAHADSLVNINRPEDLDT